MNGDDFTFDPPGERSRPGILASVRAHVRLVALCFLIGVIVGYLGSLLLPTSYTAEASFYLRVDKPFTPFQTSFGGDVDRFTGAQAGLVRTAEVMQGAANRLSPPPSLKEVASSITVSSADTGKVTITAEGPTAERARALADALIVTYRELTARRVQELAAEARAVTADDQLRQEIELQVVTYGDGVFAVDPAVLPARASAPLPTQNALLAGLAGIAAATAFAVLRDRRRARHASVADLDLLVGAPLITRYRAPASAALPDMIDDDLWSDASRAGHDVLAAVDVAMEGSRSPSVLLLSWQRPLTTTSLAVSIALAGTRSGRRVTLMDGGLKEQGISALTGIDPGDGIEALSNPSSPISASLRSWHVGESEVDVVPIDGRSAGPIGAAARPQILRSAIGRLQDRADLVVVDGPPLTERSVGLALGRGVEGVILVIDEETSIDDAHEMGRRISLSGVSVIGYVLAAPAHGPLPRLTWSPQRSGEGPLSLGATWGSHRP